MKQLRSLFLLLLFAMLPLAAGAQEKGGGEKLDIPEIVLEHLSDSYEWHIATFGGKSVSIPLPIMFVAQKQDNGRSARPGACPKTFSSMSSITEKFMSAWPTERPSVL